MSKPSLSISAIFISSCVVMLVVLAIVGYVSRTSMQLATQQQLKSNIAELQSSLTSAVLLADTTQSGKTLRNYSRQYETDLAHEATDNLATFEATQYDGVVVQQARTASDIARQYARTMAVLVQDDDQQRAAQAALPTLRELEARAGDLEDGL